MAKAQGSRPRHGVPWHGVQASAEQRCAAAHGAWRALQQERRTRAKARVRLSFAESTSPALGVAEKVFVGSRSSVVEQAIDDVQHAVGSFQVGGHKARAVDLKLALVPAELEGVVV